jgi:hypothetical protein
MPLSGCHKRVSGTVCGQLPLFVRLEWTMGHKEVTAIFLVSVTSFMSVDYFV